jgi:transposase-like protein
MPLLPDKKTSSGAGPVTDDGGTPVAVTGPAAISTELGARPRRRRFSAKEKLRVLNELDAVAGETGASGRILRREGLYSSAITDWRRQREAGQLEALKPVQRGPKPREINPLAADLLASQRECVRLSKRLQYAEAIIEVQKKLNHLLGSPETGDEPT